MATAEAVPACEVAAGDVLVLPGSPASTVTRVTSRALQADGTAPEAHVLAIEAGGDTYVRLPLEHVFRVVAVEDDD